MHRQITALYDIVSFIKKQEFERELVHSVGFSWVSSLQFLMIQVSPSPYYYSVCYYNVLLYFLTRNMIFTYLLLNFKL